MSEQTKVLKKYQVTIKNMQDQMDEDQRNYDEMREQFGIQERKLTIVMTELDETRSALESNERSRKQAEGELLELMNAPRRPWLMPDACPRNFVRNSSISSRLSKSRRHWRRRYTSSQSSSKKQKLTP